MLKKILKIVGASALIFLAVNGVSALSPSVLEAIQGLPLGDQVTFIATELDNVKREQACQKAFDASGVIDNDTANDIEARKAQLETSAPWNLDNFLPYYNECVGK